MTPLVIWNGTAQESVDLSSAVARHCGCQEGATNGARCAPHRMLLSDQRALDGLLFVRRIVERLHAEEWRPLPHGRNF